MCHIRELMAHAKVAYPADEFFSGVEQSLKIDAAARAYYRAYERALSTLDPKSWEVLRDKAIAHFANHRTGQWKQGFFDQLNDAFAYQYLIQSGYKNVRILREDGKRQPDIEYMDGGETRFCEVKTIGLSDIEIARRSSGQFTWSTYGALAPEFLLKLETTLSVADCQINARGGKGGLIYLLMHFDDPVLEYYDRYREQISAFFESHSVERIYIKIGVVGSKNIRKMLN